MNVQSILGSKGANVFTVTPGNTITEIAEILDQKRIGAIVVTNDDGSLAGIMSERDIIRGINKHGPDALTLTVADLMTTDVHCCSRADSIIDVMAMMTDRRIRHIPVVEKGKLLGIISIGDVVKHRILEAEQDAEAMRRYIASG